MRKGFRLRRETSWIGGRRSSSRRAANARRFGVADDSIESFKTSIRSRNPQMADRALSAPKPLAATRHALLGAVRSQAREINTGAVDTQNPTAQAPPRTCSTATCAIRGPQGLGFLDEYAEAVRQCSPLFVSRPLAQGRRPAGPQILHHASARSASIAAEPPDVLSSLTLAARHRSHASRAGIALLPIRSNRSAGSSAFATFAVSKRSTSPGARLRTHRP